MNKPKMNIAEENLPATSKKDLATGVLKQAAQDLRRFHDATGALERELYRDAYSWVISDDETWPFSFLNVCQLLNVAPTAVRDELLGDQSLGVPSFYFRRCRRAARRLQISLSNIFGRNITAVERAELTLAPH